MRLHLPRPSVRRAMLSIVVFAAFLALIRHSYKPPVYGDEATILLVSQARRTAGVMAAHERRLASPENLRRVSLDPRLVGLKRPLRLASPNEFIGRSPVPTVHVSVRSVEDGILSVDSEAEGPEEAKAIAEAVAHAYIAEQGGSRLVPGPAGLPAAYEIHPAPISSPSELATAMALGSLASSFVLFAPAAWFTKRRLAATAVVAPAASVLLRELFINPAVVTYEPIGLASAMIVGAALGLGAMRRPWALLPLPLLICVFAPVTSPGWNGPSLAVPGSGVAWVIGATAGWVRRGAGQGGGNLDQKAGDRRPDLAT